MDSVPLIEPESLIGRAARDLDWSILLDRLAGMTTTEAGARRLRGRELEPDWESARASMQRSAECLSLSDEGLALPVATLPDLQDLVPRLARGLSAAGTELRDLGRMLAFAGMLRAFVTTQQQARPTLASWLATSPSLDQLGARLQRSLDDDGLLRDDASTALGRARTRVKQARQDLLAQLKRLMHAHADLLRDQYFSERDGRYVIPVRSDAHRAIEGIVLDTSASGNTLFVEPRELTEHGNRLRLAQSEVAHEEQRLLRELSAEARELAPELHQAENACIEADILAALARWARQGDAVAIMPEREPVLELRAARHPLLVGRTEVVANDLELASGQALVLSGPNAGGKTVSLKCLGLAARMARAGIPLCVAVGSKVGFFSSIFSEIGDSQSIVASLSTFSAHVLVLASILAQASDSCLVLLDEVAGGTDPEQGAALATAYLEALLERGAAVAATTHYEALKELGNTDPRFHNAAVGFDVRTMLPTFRILNGVAGPSTALSVAARYGIPDAIVARAHAMIPEFGRDREQLLESLTAERAAAERLRREAERDAAEQRRLRLELEEERATVRTQFQRQLEQEYRDLTGRVRVARSELDNVKQRLRDIPQERAALSRLEREIDEAAHVTAIGSPLAEAVRTSKSANSLRAPLNAAVLLPGKRVHVARLGTDVELLESPRKGTVRVRAGSVTVSVSVDELSAPTGSQGTKTKGAAMRSKGHAREILSVATPRPNPSRMSHNTLDLRGERVDAAIDRVDAFVDELLRRGEPAGFVLHGHGTGALKQAVRDHVRSLRQVAESGPAGPEDGGDAFTLVWLAD